MAETMFSRSRSALRAWETSRWSSLQQVRQAYWPCMVARHQTASRLACRKAVSNHAHSLLLPPTLSLSLSNSAAPRTPPRPALLWRFDHKQSTHLLPTFPPLVTTTTTNLPKLHSPTGKHLFSQPAPVIADHAKLHPFPGPFLREAYGAPADCVRHSRRRHG